MATEGAAGPAHKNMRASWIAYLIALHVFTAALVLRTSFLDQARVKMIEWGAIPISGRQTFVGDSIMANAPVEGANLAISGLTTDGALRLLRRYDLSSAQTVYLLIGANDLRLNQPPRFREIAEHLRGANVVWSAILPARTALQDMHEAANSEAREACSMLPRCRFVTPAIGPKHQIDGVHLNDAGYRVLLDSLTRPS